MFCFSDSLLGDWDRRNRLKIYKGLLAAISRDFKKSSMNFLDGVSTFASSELCSYDVFVFYTVITSFIALERVDLKKKVIDSPEIITGWLGLYSFSFIL